MKEVEEKPCQKNRRRAHNRAIGFLLNFLNFLHFLYFPPPCLFGAPGPTPAGFRTASP